uniref:60S ribosomal protein L27 n=1 Tax=Pyxicephalus adspersus TaxID=30357 RepID=A0AAV3ABT7_PYXAD|nr:TPA: hypothetical protein GDO54_012689 [Pyxicephalus adspersus]
MKPGKVILVLAGGYAAHKTVTVKTMDDGTSDHQYSHALKSVKHSKNKSSMKVYNYDHLMPTKNSVDIPLNKALVNKNVFRDLVLKCKAKRQPKVKFEERYKTGKNK